MNIPKWFTPVMSVIILVVILIGFFLIQTEINGLKSSPSSILPASSTPTPKPVVNGQPNLVCSDTNLSISYEHGYHYLMVEANITNIGNGAAGGVYLWIQTYFPNGTEAVNYNMTLYEFWVAQVSLVPSMAPQTVSISSGQSYLVQNGNLIEDDNGGISHTGFPLIPDSWVGNNDFFASYKLTPLYENG